MAYDPAFNRPAWKRAVQRSHNRYMNMKNSSAVEYDVIDSYRGEIDPDDWTSAPLLVSYQIMNWAIKKINKNNNARRGIASNKPNYLPELLKENGLKQSQINSDVLVEQVKHAKILDAALHTFSPLEKNESIIVYRGENCNSFYYQKAGNMKIGDELVILPFLSTSINPNVATRFTSRMNANKACLWEIKISPGQIFPYVSEFVPEHLGNAESANQSEQEVLLPTHARLRLVSKSVDQSPKIYRFELVGFAEKSPDFWDKTLANLLSVLPQAPVLRRSERLNPRKPSGGGSKRSVRKTRKRTKNNRKTSRRTRK